MVATVTGAQAVPTETAMTVTVSLTPRVLHSVTGGSSVNPGALQLRLHAQTLSLCLPVRNKSVLSAVSTIEHKNQSVTKGKGV